MSSVHQRLRSVIKSKVAIGVLSLLYVVCMAHLYYLSVAQSTLITKPEKTMLFLQQGEDNVENKEFEKKMLGLLGPMQFKDRKDAWGWPASNTWFRLTVFTLLTTSMVLSWIYLWSQTFGRPWRFNLLLIFAFIAVCFRYLLILIKSRI